MTIITLTTDFGLKDGNAAVMKGVVLGIAPQVELVDLSHLIQPQNILEGAWVVGRSAPYFPAGTIHLVVVDPGVGTARRPIAARLGDQNFVGPDNGLLTPLLERAEQDGKPVAIVWLDQPRFWRSEVSDVFHGRDIFSAAAAHWASGVELNELGTSIHDPVRLSLPQPILKGERLVGEVMHVDSFGNVASNIRREDLVGWGEIEVRVKGETIPGLVRTFGERPPGALIALYGSTGNLIVSVVNGNAAERLQSDVGDEVAVLRVGKR